jgi:uncharacterized protein with PIN domain
MSQATFCFHAELNDFLLPGRRAALFEHAFAGRVSIKDMIESLGVPHTEVEAILVGGRPVDFAYLVQDGDQVAVYPASTLPSNQPLAPLRPPRPAEPRFVLDTHLGQLAAYLRMLGFDKLYRNDYPDEELARISSEDERILLTRDRGLLKRGIVTYGRYVRETDPQRQVAEVVRRYRLAATIAPLRRCIRCNGLLHTVHKEQISDRLAPKTREYYDEFSVCEVCDQIYWKGTHYQHMRVFIEQVLAAED